MNLKCAKQVEEGVVKRLHNVWLQLSRSRKGKMMGPETKAMMVRGYGYIWGDYVLGYYSTPTREATMKNTGNNKCWWKCGETGGLIHCWWGWKMVQPLWKTVWWFLKRLHTELPCDPAIPFENVHPQKNLYTGVHSSITYISQNIYQMMNGYRKRGMYIQQCFIRQ